MRTILFCICAFLFFPLQADIRKETYLEKGWKFQRGDIKEAMLPEFNDKKWEAVTEIG